MIGSGPQHKRPRDAPAGPVVSPERVARDGGLDARHVERMSSVTGGEEGAPDLFDFLRADEFLPPARRDGAQTVACSSELAGDRADAVGVAA